MKLTLLSTTALISAGLAGFAASSRALADEGVQLGIGGYYASAAGLILEQTDKDGSAGHNTRDVVFRQDVEVYFQGMTTLDNGVTVGAVIQMEGQQSDDQIDEVYAYFQGGWGQIRFGSDDDATEQLGYLIPSASNIFGVDSPDFEFGNDHGNGFSNGNFQTNDTLLDISGDATKIIYFSPSFGGFNFAVSYAPDRRGEDSYSYWSGPGGTTLSNNTGQVQDVFSIALEFDQDFNGLGLASGVGFAEGQWENPMPRQGKTTWGMNAHLDLSYSGFTLGGSMAFQNNYTTLGAGADFLIYGVGATYSWDLWTVGLAWSHGDYEYASRTDEDDLDIIEFTGRYDLGSGISLDAMVGVNNLDTPASSPRSDYTAWQAGMGFYIGF
ncbi:hypothetical protein FRZ44_52250 [Hypericibacter terrae]|uniref:Porin domain-containing protein n=1 Tax=Hypericibacter terrae TaxID=2602015 RepID=A0A5J6MUX0_9PROT|nr:porin [Hypericibacter terrae]QEX19910.1 hypothetical protein FRZ44_52250 [Hypericibacter terrae]